MDAAWPTYQQHVVPANVKWAGSVAVYPGCNMRYRVDQHSKLPAPMLILVGEKDDMTLPKPCMDLADEYAAAGHPVSYKVYAGATHVFDRLNQPWKKYNEGNFNLCSMDVRMPYGANDRNRWGLCTTKSRERRSRTTKSGAHTCRSASRRPGSRWRVTKSPRASRERCFGIPERHPMKRAAQYSLQLLAAAALASVQAQLLRSLQWLTAVQPHQTNGCSPRPARAGSRSRSPVLIRARSTPAHLRPEKKHSWIAPAPWSDNGPPRPLR